MFSVNKLINLIQTDIKNNFDPGYEFVVENLFGIPKEDWQKKFHQSGSIFIIWEGRTNEKESNVSLSGECNFSFIITEQTVARNSEKSDYLIDEFMSFLTEHKFGREITNIHKEFGDYQFEPLVPTADGPEDMLAGGITVFFIVSSMKYEIK